MEKFFDKLGKMNTILFYCAVLLIQILWNIVATNILNLFGVMELTDNPENHAYITSHWFFIPYYALIEELTFRWLPTWLLFSFLLSFFNNDELRSKIEKYGIVIIVPVSSIIFGYIHGSVFNIFFQGVGGFLMFIVFLRSFYKENIKKKIEEGNFIASFIFKPVISATVYHSIYNLIIFGLTLFGYLKTHVFRGFLPK